jgi:ribonuclease P protein component
MRRSADFSRAVRRGTRAGRSTLVVHLMPRADGERARVGFVVSKAVGGAVVRNLVKRRLRAILRGHLTGLAGNDVVVRALPGAAGARFSDLATDVGGAVETARRRAAGVVPHD